MVTKSDMVRQAIEEKDYKKALKIAKDFRINISKEDNADMKRAYECMVSPNFYVQLGYDLSETINKGVEVVIRLYGNQVEIVQ